MDGGYSPMMSTRYVPWRMRGCKLKKPGLWQSPQKRTPRPDRSTLPTMVLNGQIGGLPGLSLPRDKVLQAACQSGRIPHNPDNILILNIIKIPLRQSHQGDPY
ncbi:hypothetical protein GCM10027256_07080 [Novispirillum itersonii subsp. nipponicum]